MKCPVKPCEGRLSSDLDAVLERNKDRAQWATYRCEICGALVGATRDRGRWIAEQHWPSVKYVPPTPHDKKHRVPSSAVALAVEDVPLHEEIPVLAEAGSESPRG